MIDSGKPFHNSVSLVNKYQTKLKKLVIDKHSYLFSLNVSDEEKRFYNIERKNMSDCDKH